MKFIVRYKIQQMHTHKHTFLTNENRIADSTLFYYAKNMINIINHN